MTDSRILPGARARLVDANGVTSREFYDFFRRLQESGVSEEQIRELAIKLGSPDGTIANIPDNPGGIQSIIGQAPIVAAGNTVSLASLAQTVGGELVGVTVDGFGRVSQTRPVVPGAGIEIDGTTDPAQIEIINDNPNVMTTLGDMIRADTGGVPERLPIGTNGQVLTVVSGEPNWATSTSLTNPMTTLGDIITGGASGTPQRLGIGSAGQVLTVVSGAPAWAAVGGSVNVQDEGTTVVTGASAINFVGAGVTATAAGSVATVTIPGGSDPWTYAVLSSDVTSTSTTAANVSGFSVSPVANKTIVIEGQFLTRAAVTTTGCRPGANWPTDVDGVIQSFNGASSTTNTDGNANSQGGAWFNTSGAMPNTTGSWPFWFTATLVCGASPTGTFNVTLQSEIAGSEVRLRAGSWIRYRTIN